MISEALSRFVLIVKTLEASLRGEVQTKRRGIEMFGASAITLLPAQRAFLLIILRTANSGDLIRCELDGAAVFRTQSDWGYFSASLPEYNFILILHKQEYRKAIHMFQNIPLQED